LGASGISRNNKTSKLSALDTRKGSNREFIEAVLIFARRAIATFDNICIETQDGARYRLVPRDRTCKERWQAVCLQQGRPSHIVKPDKAGKFAIQQCRYILWIAVREKPDPKGFGQRSPMAA
jgi:hypothetical protein